MPDLLRPIELGSYKNDVEDAKYMLLLLVPTRTSKLEIHVESPADGIAPAVITCGRWSVGLEWSEGVRRGLEFTLLAEFEGEIPRPHARNAEWVLPSQLQVGFSEEKTVVNSLSFLELNELKKALEESPAPVPGIFNSVEYREFFRDYEYATNSDLFATNPDLTDAEKKTRCKAIHAVGELLWDRILDRYQGQPLAACGASTKSYVKYLSSELQRPIFEKHFGKPLLKEVEDAFDLFASRRLMDYNQTFNYMPDGENVFLFAEFALLALQCGVDEDFWTLLVNTFIRTQELYIASQHAQYPHVLSADDVSAIHVKYPVDVLLHDMNKLVANVTEAYASPKFNMKKNDLCSGV